MAKVKLEDLLARKGVDVVKKATYESKELGGELEITKYSVAEVLELVDRVNSKDSALDNYIASCKLIFKHCNIFKNEELLKEFKVGEPWEIVPLLLNENMREIEEIANLIMDLYNFTDETDIKN